MESSVSAAAVLEPRAGAWPIPTPSGAELTRFTHYGSAAAPVFFGAGYVPLGTWWRIGAILSVMHIAIWLIVGSMWWKLLGLW